MNHRQTTSVSHKLDCKSIRLHCEYQDTLIFGGSERIGLHLRGCTGKTIKPRSELVGANLSLYCFVWALTTGHRKGFI